MKHLLILATAALLSGCAQQTFYVNGQDGVVAKENMDMFFISGIGQAKNINAAAVCGSADRVVKVESQTGVMDNVIGIFSGGIVTPRTSRVYCAR